jgi:hypothetical protein
VEIDRGREVRGVPEAASFPFDAHDLTVEAFGHAVRDPVLHEPKNAVEMTLHNVAATFLTGSRRERTAQPYHCVKNRVTAGTYAVSAHQQTHLIVAYRQNHPESASATSIEALPSFAYQSIDRDTLLDAGV